MKYENIKSGIASEIDMIISESEKYLFSIDTKGNYFFSISEEDIKNYYSNYRKLTSLLLKATDQADKLSADLSRLICESDMAMDNQNTYRASLLLNSYCEWRDEMAKFMNNSDNSFLRRSEPFKISAITTDTKIFIEACKKLKGILQ